MVHTFKALGQSIAIDVESGAIHLLDVAAFDLLNAMIAGDTDMPADPANKAAYDELMDLKAKGQLFADAEQVDFNQEYFIKALCLHVSHDCNLRCKYCFAATGDFKTGRKLMDFEVAKAAIDFVISESGKRRNIEVDFFGGEPLMAFDVVKQTVEYAREQEKAHGKNFRFTITTNGLDLDDQTIEYINQNMDNLVLSLDGREKINDDMRKTPQGESSYSAIVPRFLRVKETRDKDYFLRGTFTAKNLDFVEDVKHIAGLGFRNISIEPVVTSMKSLELTPDMLEKIYAEYEKLAEYLLENPQTGFFHFNIDLSGGPCIAKRLKGCGAGYEYIAVTPEGDIYPCHQFVGTEEFKLGNLHQNTFDRQMSEKFSKISVNTKPECKACWAKYYCSGGCSACNHFMEGDIYVPYKIGCSLQKKRIELAIAMLACK